MTTFKCEHCGKGVSFDAIRRCQKCGRYVCRTCISDEKTHTIGRLGITITKSICSDCFFSELQKDIMVEQFSKEMSSI